MTATYKFVLVDSGGGCYDHHCENYSGDQSGEYVRLSEHSRELANAQATVEMARVEALEAENARLKDVLMAVTAYRHAKATVPENNKNILSAYKDLIEALDNANP